MFTVGVAGVCFLIVNAFSNGNTVPAIFGSVGLALILIDNVIQYCKHS